MPANTVTTQHIITTIPMNTRPLSSMSVADIRDIIATYSQREVMQLAMSDEMNQVRSEILARAISDEQKELITFIERVLRIYHSSKGERSVNKLTHEVIEQMVFPDENDVFFHIRIREYAILEIVFCVQDVYFNIPIKQLPTGTGVLNPFHTHPIISLGVENIKGEIADLMEDYLDQYGTDDEYIPSV